MKKMFLLSALCVMSLTTTLLGQTHTQSISFDDGVGPGNAGTYNSTDSFGVDLYLTYSGYNAYGLSLWFATSASGAPFISLTGMSYGTTFPDPNQPFITFPLNFTQPEAGGLYGTPNPSDLGSGISTSPPFNSVPPGTYFIGHLSVSLAGLPPGIYTLQTDTWGPHASEVADTDFMDNNVPAALYTITVVPEPETVVLFALGSLGMAAIVHRRKRAK